MDLLCLYQISWDLKQTAATIALTDTDTITYTFTFLFCDLGPQNDFIKWSRAQVHNGM